MATFQQTVDTLNATYRQANHWVGRGYLPITQAHPGTGYPRHLTGREVALLQAMDALVTAGFTPKAASRHAPHLVDDGHITIAGLTITRISQEAA